MVLRRLGNKKKLAARIVPHFPNHIDTYIEPFFGAGGLFFHKPKSKYNLVNDNDSDVYNFFKLVSTRPKKLKKAIRSMPIHEDLWNHWRKHKETDPIPKALRFLFLSNFGFMGKGETLRFMSGNSKRLILERFDATCEMLADVEFTNCDFRELFKRLPIRNPSKTFVYCDPPYLDTDHNYSSGFKKEDSFDLFNVLCGTGLRFAMSEFDHPFVIAEAKRRRLNIIEIGERRNLRNRRMEILVTNYSNCASIQKPGSVSGGTYGLSGMSV